MTGEITLRGQVLPVGGIKEKVLAAKKGRSPGDHSLLAERKDIQDIDSSFIKGLKFNFVKNMQQVLELALA